MPNRKRPEVIHVEMGFRGAAIKHPLTQTLKKCLLYNQGNEAEKAWKSLGNLLDAQTLRVQIESWPGGILAMTCDNQLRLLAQGISPMGLSHRQRLIS